MLLVFAGSAACHTTEWTVLHQAKGVFLCKPDLWHIIFCSGVAVPLGNCGQGFEPSFETRVCCLALDLLKPSLNIKIRIAGDQCQCHPPQLDTWLSK